MRVSHLTLCINSCLRFKYNPIWFHMQNYNNNIYMYINFTHLSFKTPSFHPTDDSPMGNLPHTGCDEWFLLITESNSPYRVWRMIPDDNQVKLTFHFVVCSKTHLVKYVKVPFILVLHHNTRLQQKKVIGKYKVNFNPTFNFASTL